MVEMKRNQREQTSLALMQLFSFTRSCERANLCYCFSVNTSTDMSHVLALIATPFSSKGGPFL
jgi:hypothetical protein